MAAACRYSGGVTAKITIRIPDELHEQLVAAADEDRRSLNSEIVWLLDFALKEKL